MANEAERVVVEVLAKVGNFDGTIKTSATAFDGSMKKIETSATRAEKTVGTSVAKIGQSTKQLQQSSRLLGLQIADIGVQLSAGTSPFLILAQQGPQVANALEGAKGAVGRFAAFLSGPWGAALLAAISILGVYGSKLFETEESIDDLVQKLKDQADKTKKSDEATKLFGQSLEGLEQAAKDAEKALEALENRQKTQEQQTVESIQTTLNKVRAIRAETEALLDAAEASNKQFEGSLASADPRIGNALKIQQSAIDELRKRIEKAKKDAEELEKKLTRAISFRTVEEASLSAEEAINRKYDKQVENARKAAVATGLVTDALRKQIEAINAAREADLKRYRDSERERRKTSTGLPDVTGAEIARALGTTITSGKRSAARNKAVGGSDNSYHLSGQAIDIPLTVNGRPLTKAGIRAVLEPLGVEIKELLGPGDAGHSDHFHIAFGKKRRGPDEVADAAQKAADAETRRRQAFENELASLQGQEIDARQSLITSAEEIAKLELAAIEISRQKYDDNLNALVEQKKLTADEATQLRAINEERAKLRAELVKRREDERKFRVKEEAARRAADFATGEIDVQEDLLQSQQSVAKTARERRDLESKLLDLQYRSERIMLEAIIADYERLKIKENLTTLEREELARRKDQAELAKQRLGTLDERRANDETQNREKNASPLQAYLQDIPNEAKEIDAAFEAIAAGGLRTFTDSLTDAIVNFRSLGDVGRAVLRSITADLVRMAIQQIILRTIGQTAGNAAVVTATAQGAALAAAMAPAAAMASLASFGANAAPAAAALTATTLLASALAIPKGFASGGPISGPGTGTSDSVPLWGSNGEYMIQAKSAAKLGRNFLDHINITGEMPMLADGGPVRSIRPSNAPAATRGAPGGGITRDDLNRLEAAMRDAAGPPNISLFPTLRPEDAFLAGLNSPAGQRAFFNFVDQNSAKFNSQLGRR